MTRTPQRRSLEDARQRIRQSEQALEASLRPSASLLQEAFDGRARQLGQAARDDDGAGASIPILVSRIGELRCGIRLEHVAEIGPLRRCTTIPDSRPGLYGVFAHRGLVCSAIDLGVLVGIARCADAKPGYFIHMRCAGREVRLRVDALDEILKTRPADLRTLCGPGRALPGELVEGLTREGVVLLRAEALLSRILTGPEEACAARRAMETDSLEQGS